MKKRKIIHVDEEDLKIFKKITFANDLKNDEKKFNFLLQNFLKFKNTCEENNILKNNIQYLKEKSIQENEMNNYNEKIINLKENLICNQNEKNGLKLLNFTLLEKIDNINKNLNQLIQNFNNLFKNEIFSDDFYQKIDIIKNMDIIKKIETKIIYEKKNLNLIPEVKNIGSVIEKSNCNGFTIDCKYLIENKVIKINKKILSKEINDKIFSIDCNGKNESKKHQICNNCKNFKNKLKYYQKKIKFELNTEKFILNNKIENTLLNDKKIELLKKKLK
jgi:hypothetical protein